jgi:RNA polymerase sigma factor (TIGR02999 family)
MRTILKAAVASSTGGAPSSQRVTRLLRAWTGGDPAALDPLIDLVHGELRRMARRHMRRERADHTLQTSALINEAYVRLVDIRRVQWQDRAHFFAMAARLMRRILVDHARARGYLKRGRGVRKVSFDEAPEVAAERGHDLVALDDALKALEAVDARKSQVIELRFFGGLSVEETAEALKVSPDTVMRDWRLAKAWLLRELKASPRS